MEGRQSVNAEQRAPADKPAGKDERDTLRCQVVLVAIKFNHAPRSFSTDAMNIRVDANREVQVPEWTLRSGAAEESPAAYAMEETEGQTVSIQCKFVMIPPPRQARAGVRADGGGVLGPIEPLEVPFVNGVSRDESHGGDPQYVQIPLRQRSFAGIERQDIAWRWSFHCEGSGSAGWLPLETTRHRIYVGLRGPSLPWSQADAQLYPWTKALDYAIVTADTRGLDSEEDAATRITQHVYQEPLLYEARRGAPAYSVRAATHEYFLIDQWLDGFRLGRVVNCYDTAAALVTFANVLGCRLRFQYHDRFGYLQTVRPIGRALGNNPFYLSDVARVRGLTSPMAGEDDPRRTRFDNHAYGKQEGDIYDAGMKATPGLLTSLGRYVVGILSLIFSVGRAAGLARRRFLQADGWLIELAQDDYEDAVIDTSTPGERAAAGGRPERRRLLLFPFP